VVGDDVCLHDRFFLPEWERKRHVSFGVQPFTEHAIDTIQGRGHLVMVGRYKEQRIAIDPILIRQANDVVFECDHVGHLPRRFLHWTSTDYDNIRRRLGWWIYHYNVLGTSAGH
jgi:hypothetical protein